MDGRYFLRDKLVGCGTKIKLGALKTRIGSKLDFLDFLSGFLLVAPLPTLVVPSAFAC
jgi:hypothetical protein